MSSRSRPDARRRRAGPAPVAAATAHPARPGSLLRSRGWRFALFAGVCVAVAVGYVAWTVIRERTDGRPAISGPVAIADDFRIALVAGGGGTLMFQNAVPGESWGRVGLVPLGGTERPRTIAPLACMRVAFAADRGLCLAEDGGSFTTDEGLFSTHAAYIFGPDFQVTHQIPLSGFPSRARVSPDGRYAATTVFVTGHSYADGGFSTETTLIDLASGDRLATLEQFTVLREGSRFESIDFNFWGVTFTSDSNRFYATLGTRGQTYLVEGDVAARQIRVVRENVECPSLSPDGTRIAFKKRVGGDFGTVTWRFHVLDLETMTETPLAETRSIDDQIEWLDDGRVLYGDGTDVWMAQADGSGEPSRYISKATSPVVVRSASPPTHDTEGKPVKTLSLPPTDLAIAVSAPTDPARVGQNLTFTITVTNRGPGEATDVHVEQYLPEGVTSAGASTVSFAGRTWGCSQYLDERRVTCDTPVLPAGESWTIALTFTPTTAGTIEHRAAVFATEPDSLPENDTATTALTVTEDS